MFELLLTLALQVVNSSDASKLVYKLTNIQMEYEAIHSKKLSNTATRTYTSIKYFTFDYIIREAVVTFEKNKESRLNIRVNPQCRSLKGILLLLFFSILTSP